MSFMSVFLVRLGAPTWLVGLYTSAPALVAIFVALPVGAFVQSRRNSLVPVANWSRLIFRGTVGLFALLPWLPPGLAPYILVGARTLVEIPAEAANISFTTILSMITPPLQRPRMLSTRMMINGIAAALVGLLAGQWLDWAPYPLNYQLLFLTSFFAGLASIYTLSFLRLPEPEAPSRHAHRMSLLDLPALVRSAPRFRQFLIAAFIFRMGMSMPSALYSVYRVRVLGSTDAWIGVLQTVERVLHVIVYFFLARLMTKEKNQRWLWLACIGTTLYPLTTALSTTPQMLLMPSIVVGIFGSGMNVFMTNMLFAVSPEDRRPTFVAANACLTSVTAFVAPMIGTAIAELTSINFALMIVAGLRLVGALSFWFLGVTRDRAAPA